MSSSNSPCAACKLLRRKCTPGCVFAPYFPPDQPTKFAYVHRVFGASNVTKLLNDLSPAQREDAVNSLAYEAQARLTDPVHGCVGYICLLQQKLEQVQTDLNNAKKELATYIGPAALGPFLPQPRHHPLMASQYPYQYNHSLQGGSASSTPPFGVPGVGVGMGMSLGLASPAAMQQHPQILLREQQQHDHQQQHIDEAQQQQQLAVAVAAAAAAREQEMFRNYNQQQEQIARFGNSAFPVDGNGRGYGQIGAAGGNNSGLTLVPAQTLDMVQQQHQHLQQINEQASSQQNHLQSSQHHRVESDEGRSVIGGPSC